MTTIMKAAAKSKVQSFKGQFLKFIAIVNPKLGNEFFEEVSQTYFCDHWNPCDGSWSFD